MCFQVLEPACIQSHSEYLKDRYKSTRFTTDQEEWPPDQPKHFTTLAMIHHKDGHTERNVIAVTKVTQKIQSDEIDTIMSPSSSQMASPEQPQEQVKTSKDVQEIFAPNKDGQEPRRILIEGAPGIGKTVLSKEIAVKWADGLLLVNEILVFLIFLRDPLVRTIKSLKDLVKYYYQFDESSENVASSCAEYLLHSRGKNVTFIFDGYDEYPENLQLNGFISDILHGRVLPNCHLVVTSRPHASAHIRRNCDRYIEVLGFTKEDRQNYITSYLKEKQDVDKLVQYLDTHLTISSLCYIPFNMTVLLWLYKLQEITLLNCSTELYNYFICHTIRHHLAKYQICLCDSFLHLNSLEEPYGKVIKQLSFLSYNALDKNQLTFTLDEIKTVCPQIDEIPEALNGFGLLQAVQYFGIKKIITFNFVHFTVQEFLAAYHISCLPHYQQFCILKEKFMSEFYANTFTFYVGMTKGQNPGFKHYVNGSNTWIAYIHGLFPFNLYKTSIVISPELLVNIRVCFRLFKCFLEAGDEVLCNEIGKADHFSKGTITLLPSDVECLGIFLGSSKEWQELYFHRSVDDVGFQILHQLLTNKNSTCIHKFNIGNGGSWFYSTSELTQSSSCLITDIVKSCKTKVLEVLRPVLLCEDVASLKNQLTELKFFVHENQTSAVITFIPMLLHGNKVLKLLELYHHRITDNTIIALVKALECNDESYVENEYYGKTICFKYKNRNGEVEITFVGLSPLNSSITVREVLKHIAEYIDASQEPRLKDAWEF